ncbi:MAG: OmpH family outer membrane protein [Tannerella sp.]|jgi:outer membrane protein|nr:OmpH family outer membrane protein [Tannerella sp.]
MKKIIVSMLLLLPLGLAAQEMKIAIVDQQAIFSLLPELSEVESQIAAFAKQYQDQMKSMEDEYNRKFSDLTAQGDTLTENIRTLRLQEIQGIEARLQNFVPMAKEEIDKKQAELLAPLYEKMQKAVDEVGEENGYTYIMSPQVMLFKGSSAIDATDKVKAKLGLK